MKSAKSAAFLILFLATLAMLAARSTHSAKNETPLAAGERRPVLLELFTSEGCSSCPPADKLLETFDRTQPVAGADLIVLSEHVDYWNRLGWTDPFSSAQFSERQQDYVRRLHLDGAYTPQMIVDGQREVIGSDKSAAEEAIAKAIARPKTAIGLTARRAGGDVTVSLKIAGALRGASVYVSLAEDHAQSQVSRGENSGRVLQHVAVVRTLLSAGKIDAQGTFPQPVTLPLKDELGAGWRVVVFLQDPASTGILGAAQTRL